MPKQHKNYCRSWIDVGNTRVFCMLEAGHDPPHVSRDWEVDTKRRLTERVHMREIRWWYASALPVETVSVAAEIPMLEDRSNEENAQ